jgi:DeoR family transcriptional regulator, aga operon transcriptional repressor
MQRKQRLNQIVSAVVQEGSLDVDDLAARFAVSHATIRRDLEMLEQQRLVTRTHGGVTTHPAFNDLPLGYKNAQDLAEKRRIAQKAMEHLDSARVVGLTGGTTVTEFARLLGDAGARTVVTNALNVAVSLASNSDIQVFNAGGEVRSSSLESVGSSAVEFISGYNIDVAFIGVDGVDPVAGCTNYDPGGVAVNAVLMDRARTRIVLADATKLGKVALARVCEIARVDILITDTRADPDVVTALQRSGCEVVLA